MVRAKESAQSIPTPDSRRSRYPHAAVTRSRSTVPTTSTRNLVERLIESLDPATIGDLYCDEGGETFWLAHRAPVLAQGTAWATELGQRLGRGGTSLYIGAGVAELPALLAEVCDLGRRCVATSLRGPECALLNQALAAVGLGDRLCYQAVDATAVLERGPFQHLAMVSVLTDPETSPEVSAVTYGRADPLRLDPQAFAGERARIRRQVAAWVAAVAAGGWITTTVEEVPWVLEAAAAADRRVEADDTMLETAMVKDPCGFLRIG